MSNFVDWGVRRRVAGLSGARGPIPIHIPHPPCDRANLILAILKGGDWGDLVHVAGHEHLVGLIEIFEGQNGFGPGDVLQSMTIYEDRAYLVLNDSNKIEVVDPQDFRQLWTKRYPTDVSER